MKMMKSMALVLAMLGIVQAETVWLDELPVERISQGWGNPQVRKSVGNNPLRIGGSDFERGIGTHADAVIRVQLDGMADRFTAKAGVDDEVGQQGSIRVVLHGNQSVLFKSDVVRGGDPALELDVDLSGVEMLTIIIDGAGDGIDYDHADLVDALIVYQGAKPELMEKPVEEPFILTPPPPATPRINGATIFGVRPGSPFIYRIPATGDRPMQFSVENLPEGLEVDSDTGIITGTVNDRTPQAHEVIFKAENSKGKAERAFTIQVGDALALTPPMGWNSWNCFASAVSAEKVRAAADSFVESGLANHGWMYVNIDDYWEIKPGSDDPSLQGPGRDDEGKILSNPRFPDMKGLTDYIHSLGLRAGLYSGPGPLTCGGCMASYEYEKQDAERYAEWGFDYLKYDWCSYGRIAKDGSLPELQKPYLLMRDHLLAQPRDIVYSLCQYGMGDVWEWGESVGGNLWRTTGDITDTWGSMAGIGFAQNGHAPYAGPGHWNDPDMLVVGYVGWGPNLHPTRLTPNEQYTHITLWTMLASPLLIGCDLTALDDFTLNLLTNDEVIGINQDRLGAQGFRVAEDREAQTQVWKKPLADGSMAVALFNLHEFEQQVTVKWSDLGLEGPAVLHDAWRQKDLGAFNEQFSSSIARHGTMLLIVKNATM